MKIKVQYDDNSSYIIYKNKKVRLGLLSEYKDFKIKEVICEPINTYVIIEEKGEDKEPSYEELQKRINKAIEYINDYENYCMEISHNIIAILKGEDKE